MFGAIIGDIVGSPYEFDWNNVKSKDFPLLSERSRFTDDSVMSLAVAKALLDAQAEGREVSGHDFICWMQKLGRAYPDRGYGARFGQWLCCEDPQPYGSFGNGSAMRVAASAWLFDTLADVRRIARLSSSVTHDHAEGLKGAEATAGAIWLARTGAGKTEIKTYIQQEFGYDLDRTCDGIRPHYHMDESCQGSVPEAFIAFLEGTDFEDVLRTAVLLGGDSDTIACIAGSIAEAYYGIDEEWKQTALRFLTPDLAEILNSFDLCRSARCSRDQ